MSCIIIFEACLSNHSQLSRMKRLEKLQDLVKEAKRRTFLWVILVSGLAYLFSRTSSSIWLNLPIAAFILVVIRYLSFELEIRRRVQLSEVPSHIAHLMKYQLSLDDSFSCPPSALTSWKRKIDSAVVEAAIDSFTRRIVQEFVTDLWYSALSPDQDVPQQLCLMINDIFGELAQRVKRINLITLLTRDIVDLVGNHLELFRRTKGAIMLFEYLSSEEREEKLKSSLLKRNQLHPALISSESECKVLERLMGGVVAILLRPQDAQCLLVRGIARELLACAVLRPVMNFASPGFINKAIEKAIVSAKKDGKRLSEPSKSGKKHEDAVVSEKKDCKRLSEPSKLGKKHEEVVGSGSLSFTASEGKQGGPHNTNLMLQSISIPSKQHQEGIESGVGGLHHRRTRSSSTGLEGWQKLENSSVNQESKLGFWDTPRMQLSTGSVDRDTTRQNLPVRSAASKLNCWVVGAHFEKAASKPFAVYSVAVTDSDNNTWFVERRFSNFEQLHRNLRDLPHYNLQLPPKRFWLSGLDDSFVRDRCILLDKYLKDLLLIPSIAELHEVWDFLSVTSKNYAYSKSPSVMKTLAVNVDDAVDDMFRQFKGVSDGLLGRAGGPPSHAMDAACQGGEPKLPGQVEAAIGHLDRERTEQLSDDEYGGPPSVLDGETAYLMEGWSYDKDLPMQDPLPNILPQRRLTEYDKNDQWPEKRIERGSSEAFSLEESTAGSEIFEEEHVVPPEWTPPKLTVPILNLVDSIFQLQERGWLRRQVFWMAKQILQLGMGDAVDEWLVTQIQRLRREDVVASTISMLQETLWPGGVFITKKRNAESSTDGALAKINKQASQKGMDQSAFFESQLESFRCASVVHDALVDGAPAALTSLVGKTQYTRCAKDLYYFLQSSAFLKQLVYSMLETLLIATFPELAHLIIDIRREGSGQVVM